MLLFAAVAVVAAVAVAVAVAGAVVDLIAVVVVFVAVAVVVLMTAELRLIDLLRVAERIVKKFFFVGREEYHERAIL